MKTEAILIVEDNPADVLLLTEAFERIGWAPEVILARNGLEALARLAQGPAPELVLMDLNLPIMNGREVLSALQGDPALARLPVVVLSGSEWEQDTVAALGVPGDRYFVKPMTFTGYLEIATRLRALI